MSRRLDNVLILLDVYIYVILCNLYRMLLSFTYSYDDIKMKHNCILIQYNICMVLIVLCKHIIDAFINFVNKIYYKMGRTTKL